MPRPELPLFVYGTLRAGSATGAHRHFLAGAERLGTGWARGRLVRVNQRYPGFVPDPDGGWVLGELYRLPHSAALRQLDDYEGCGLRHPRPREYRRESLSVQRASGETLRAQTYVYNWPVGRLATLNSGDFLNPRHTACPPEERA